MDTGCERESLLWAEGDQLKNGRLLQKELIVACDLLETCETVSMILVFKR